jgi:tetratricopeptide (TPR) repeat protein
VFFALFVVKLIPGYGHGLHCEVMRTDMDLPTLDHEETMLRDITDGTFVALERALLVLSGLKTAAEIRSYQQKIDAIWGRFLNKCDLQNLSDQSRPPAYLHRSIAQCLFEYLWNSKPKRFGKCFLLTDVVDAQLDPDVHRSVGTCVGLTSLYSVLGLRAGLNLSLLADLDHLLSRLRVGQQTIDIDHTDPQGFDCGTGKSFRELPVLTLTANVLNRRGLENEKNGQFMAANADFQKAILANPDYANAYNNKGNMSFRAGDFEAAIADYTEAIRLHACFCEAYCNRGMARHRLGRHVEARRDYEMAMSANAEYSDARRCLQLLDGIQHGKAPVVPPGIGEV